MGLDKFGGKPDVPFYKTTLGIFTITNSVVVLAILIVFLGVYFGHTTKDWVSSKNCVAPIGEFTVEPSVDGSPSTLCPDSQYDDKGTCIYSGVGSLLEATKICNRKSDICSKFVYNQVSQKMKIVSLKTTPLNGGQDDNTYTRQANITFKTSGSDENFIEGGTGNVTSTTGISDLISGFFTTSSNTGTQGSSTGSGY